MKRVASFRHQFDCSGKKLRRARKLYVLFARKGITNTMQLNYAAKRMRRAGLYANPQLNSVRDITYSILRMMWRLDGGTDHPWPNPDCWFKWAERNGWDIPHRRKIAA